jgi:hypothetical protein
MATIASLPRAAARSKSTRSRRPFHPTNELATARPLTHSHEHKRKDKILVSDPATVMVQSGKNRTTRTCTKEHMQRTRKHGVAKQKACKRVMKREIRKQTARTQHSETQNEKIQTIGVVSANWKLHKAPLSSYSWTVPNTCDHLVAPFRSILDPWSEGLNIYNFLKPWGFYNSSNLPRLANLKQDFEYLGFFQRYHDLEIINWYLIGQSPLLALPRSIFQKHARPIWTIANFL